MSATQFTVDLDDIRFVLFEVLDIDSKLQKIERFSEFDQETYEATLDEAARIATEATALTRPARPAAFPIITDTAPARPRSPGT